jgi:hypothetical protein
MCTTGYAISTVLKFGPPTAVILMGKELSENSTTRNPIANNLHIVRRCLRRANEQAMRHL